MKKTAIVVWFFALLFIFSLSYFISFSYFNIKGNSNREVKNNTKLPNTQITSTNNYTPNTSEDNGDSESFSAIQSVPDGFELLGELPEVEVSVYGKIKSGNHCEKIAVRYKTKIKFYDWECLKLEPSIEFKDLNSDEKEEICIVLRGAYGTGMYQCFIHLLESENLYEIPVEDYRKILDTKIKKELTSGRILLTLEDITCSLTLSDASKDVQKIYDNLYIGSNVLYSFDNNIMTCKASISSSLDDFYGCIYIYYKYNDGKFVLDYLDYDSEASDKDLIDQQERYKDL